MNRIFVIVGLSKDNLIIVDHSITLNHSLDGIAIKDYPK
jgi:hypothetical protein